MSRFSAFILHDRSKIDPVRDLKIAQDLESLVPPVFWDPLCAMLPRTPHNVGTRKSQRRRDGKDPKRRREGMEGEEGEREIGTERDREGKAVVPVLPPPRANRELSFLAPL